MRDIDLAQQVRNIDAAGQVKYIDIKMEEKDMHML